jgi:hypothetical protein
MFQRIWQVERILPFLEQTTMNSGGFPTVDEVLVHPAHWKIDPKFPETVGQQLQYI